MQQSPLSSNLPELIRVSIGTAIVLGLAEGKIDAAPTTAYIMTYRQGKCTANCAFCPQARLSNSRAELLARVTWPSYPTAQVLSALSRSVEQQKIRRVCIQALNYPQVFIHLDAIARRIKAESAVAVSVSCQPKNKEEMERLRAAGVDRLGISLDGATKAIFDRVKGAGTGGCYDWDNVFGLLLEALELFGKGNVSTHIIVGLGESERDVAEVIQRFVDLGVLPALFAFTPVRGTALEQNAAPKLDSYRRLQLARFLIVTGKVRVENMGFEGGKIINYGLGSETLKSVVASDTPFRTSGCPDCNRPYYNEKPRGPIYNYPKKPTSKEVEEIKRQLSY